MKNKKNNQSFWNHYAKIYDFEISKFNKAAYAEMYRLISANLTKKMQVLEIATGTGLIAINIATHARSVTAIDYAPKMIAAAKKKDVPANVNFAVEDATALPFADNSFDMVIISNALHVMPKPELVLENIKRVLKPDGLLIAPSFSHGHIDDSTWKFNVRFLKFLGFETYSKWRPDEYAAFIEDNGFSVKNWHVLKAGFPLVYLEAALK